VSLLLNKPVFNALNTVEARFSKGTEYVKYFDATMSPFAGFADGYEKGFEELYQLLPAGRRILYATRDEIASHQSWQRMAYIQGLQFVYEGNTGPSTSSHHLLPLTSNHVDEMIALAMLTKPGPFDKHTINFGHYFGIFEAGKLVAMTGQRLHLPGYSEISAVCTHPTALGKGYATALLQHQLHLIGSNGDIPFLHVRADNSRAIDVFERLGFKKNGSMNFSFLKK